MSTPWVNTTHDWTTAVDDQHLAMIRERMHGYAPNGVRHLILEVLAYAADEAAVQGRGRAVVTLHGDGSVSVADDGRGTDTRRTAAGQLVRKPVMATRDLRFFDRLDAPVLPDGHPRHGMSVVAALSPWLEHTNRRVEGSWCRRYVHGHPVEALSVITPDGTTGTTVHFLPDPELAPVPRSAELAPAAWFEPLRIEIADLRLR